MNINLPDSMVEAAHNVARHDCTSSCLYCLNLTAWMGENIVRIVRRTDAAQKHSAP